MNICDPKDIMFWPVVERKKNEQYKKQTKKEEVNNQDINRTDVTAEALSNLI